MKKEGSIILAKLYWLCVALRIYNISELLMD